jgi:hypothetical protein
MSEPENVTTNFGAAIGMFSDHAHDAFIAAWGALPDPEIPKDTAEGQLVAALAQLSAASSMKLQQRSQAGFDAVVDLMRTTAKAADDVSNILIPLLQRDSGPSGRSGIQAHRRAQEHLDHSGHPLNQPYREMPLTGCRPGTLNPTATKGFPRHPP